MGIFDSYLDDIKREVARVTDGAAKVQKNTRSVSDSVVKAIDNLEEKITHLPTEKQIKQTLKKSLTSPHKKPLTRKKSPKK